MTRLKAIGLFLLAPFIGLAYVFVLPWYCVYQAISCGIERSAIEAADIMKVTEEALCK
jgi:hypothetical protein